MGPVVAGVVGQERYQFDIWGDTVNVASRMSDQSKPGYVAVTKGVWEHVSYRTLRRKPWATSKSRGRGPSLSSAFAPERT